MKKTITMELKEKLLRSVCLVVVFLLTFTSPVPLTHSPAMADPQVLARVGLTPGWGTFGLALPQGAATDDLQVGSLPTQTDVKNRWEDGTIKFAVVTADATDQELQNTYDVVEASGFQGGPGGQSPTEKKKRREKTSLSISSNGIQPVSEKASLESLKPKLGQLSDTISIELTAVGVKHDVKLNQAEELLIESSLSTGNGGEGPSTTNIDYWLFGPLVVEVRSIVPIPGFDFLRAVLDIRFYSDGSAKIDLAMENTLIYDPSATVAVYDIRIRIDNEDVFVRNGVNHWYMTRWRQGFNVLGHVDSEVTHDTASLVTAGAIPAFRPSVINGQIDPNFMNQPQFDILRESSLNPYMPDHSGRQEIATVPDWAAWYLRHRDPNQRAFVLAHGDLAGSWPIHMRHSDGQIPPIIDWDPNFWLRSDEPQNRPAGDMGARGPLVPDIAHQPSLAFIPYLLTGDRYYADEMAMWANYVLAETYQNSYDNSRGGEWTGGCPQCGTPRYPGSWGLITLANETRGIGWGLRNLAHAAAYLPDDDPLKAYFTQKVLNNLEWLDEHAIERTENFGVAWLTSAPDGLPGGVTVDIWEHLYVLIAIAWANKLGFAGGDILARQYAQFQIDLLNTERLQGPLPRNQQYWSIPYRFPRWRPDGERLYTPMDAFRTLIEFNMVPPNWSPVGFYGPETRIAALYGIENNLPGAPEAFEWIEDQPGDRQPGEINVAQDADLRSGWALALDAA